MHSGESGCLYGVGVGPGDSSLITHKAATLLRRAQVVFAPRSAERRESLALKIAGEYLPASARVHELSFPMLTDEQALATAWMEAAGPVVKELRDGVDCVFVTLGDPLFFSTYIYLRRAVKELLPAARFSAVPGISSIFAAAAVGGSELAAAGETLAVIAGDQLDLLDKLEPLMTTIVIMKIGRRLPRVVEKLRRLNLEQHAFLAHRVGLEGETVVDIETGLNNPEIGYMSIIIVRKP